eukprot:2716479-Rhodomonas_salina.3
MVLTAMPLVELPLTCYVAARNSYPYCAARASESVRAKSHGSSIHYHKSTSSRNIADSRGSPGFKRRYKRFLLPYARIPEMLRQRQSDRDLLEATGGIQMPRAFPKLVENDWFKKSKNSGHFFKFDGSS